MQSPYEYNRFKHLPLLIRVKMDWLTSDDPAMGDLILQRLASALNEAKSPARVRSLARIHSLEWAIQGETQRQVYSTPATHRPFHKPVPAN